MNILFIAPISEPITGLSLASQVLYKHLKKNNNIITVDYSKGGLVHGVNSFFRIIRILQLFVSIIRVKSRCDVVYMTLSQSISGNIKDNIILFLLISKLSKTVLHLHGGGIKAEVYDKSSLLNFISRLLLKRVGSIIVLGQSLKGIFGGKINNNRIRIVHNFAEPFLFKNPTEIKFIFNNIEKVNVLYLSNLIDGKGYNELLEAFTRLPKNIKDKIQLNFAGLFDKPHSKASFLKRISGKNNIVYHGSVNAIGKERLLRLCHIFCLPTYYKYEGQPISILEAYASGCVVITTKHAGIVDIFSEGINGYYIEKQSVVSIEKIFKEILLKEEGLINIALNNNRFANNRFTQEKFLNNVSNVINDV